MLSTSAEQPTEPAESSEAAGRVSTLELFFDLVFVFTITQLTTVLAEDPTPRGLLRVLLLLGVIWWMYGGYAWLTNAIAPDRAGRRLLLLGGMASFLVLALAIPRAFGDGGLAFGLAYLVVVSIHAGLFTRTSSAGVVRAVFRLAPFNLLSALLVLSAGIAGGVAEYGLWLAAIGLEWATPRLAKPTDFEIAPAHFVERHGLVVLVALGESVVAVGIGAAGHPVDGTLAGVAVLGLLLNAGLWWTYFRGDDVRAERALTLAPRERRPTLALNAFGYWHLPLLLGIIAIAAGLETATGHPFEPLRPALALALAGGVALFLVGHELFRRSLGIARGYWRVVGAGLALATIPLGVGAMAVAQLAALVVVVGAALFAEHLAGAAGGPAVDS